MKRLNVNHNLLAVIFPLVIIFGLAFLVHNVPEISIAPEETTGQILLRVAIFFAAWPLALRFFGGWDYSVTKESQRTQYGAIAIACSIIIGCALVIMK